MWVSFWGDKNVLKLIVMIGCTTVNILKTIELYKLNVHLNVHFVGDEL